MLERVKLPSRNLNKMSHNTGKILEGVKRHFDSITSQQPSPNGVIQPDRILFKEAVASNRFQSQGLGIYKESYKNEDYGKIWVKKTFIDEKTGKQEEWLVVYTNDEEDIIRQVAMEKTASLNKVADHLEDEEGMEEPEFHSGMKVRLKEPYAGNEANEIFTLSLWDGEKGWIGDEQGRGWYVRGYQIEPVLDSEDEEDIEENFYTEGAKKQNTISVEDMREKLCQWELDAFYDEEGEDYSEAKEERIKNKYRKMPAAKVIKEYKEVTSSKIAAAPNPKNIPINPGKGIKSKDLKLNETGGETGGTVTIEFSDAEKALKFYQDEVEGGGNKEETPKEEEEPQDQADMADEQPTPPPTKQSPMPAQPAPMAPVQQASSLKKKAAASLQKKSVPGKFNPFMDENDDIPPSSRINETRGEDSFGNYLYEGDRVRDDAGKRGTIDKIVGEFAYVRWDGIAERERAPLPLSALTKWASTVDYFSDGIQGVKVYRFIQSNNNLSADPWDALLNTAHQKTSSLQPVGYGYVNEKGKYVPITLKKGIKIGEMFERPDTHNLARFAGWIDKVAEFGDSQEDDKPIECTICHAKFDDIKEAREHVKKEHGYSNADYFLLGVPTNPKKAALITEDELRNWANQPAAIDIHIEAEPEAIDSILDTIMDGLDVEDQILGGKADDIPDAEFEEEELEEGTEHEKEHTDDEDIAKEIAKDHLEESDTYYDDLEDMEEKKDKKDKKKKKSSLNKEASTVDYQVMSKDLGNGYTIFIDGNYNSYSPKYDGETVFYVGYMNSNTDEHNVIDYSSELPGDFPFEEWEGKEKFIRKYEQLIKKYENLPNPAFKKDPGFVENDPRFKDLKTSQLKSLSFDDNYFNTGGAEDEDFYPMHGERYRDYQIESEFIVEQVEDDTVYGNLDDGTPFQYVMSNFLKDLKSGVLEKVSSLDKKAYPGRIGSYEWVDSLFSKMNKIDSVAGYIPDKEDYIDYICTEVEDETGVSCDRKIAEQYYNDWAKKVHFTVDDDMAKNVRSFSNKKTAAPPILTPSTKIPEPEQLKSLSLEEREALYQEWRAELIRLNPSYFNSDGSIKTFWQLFKDVFSDKRASLGLKTAADISDEIPPVTWKEQDSKSDVADPNQAGQPLPPRDNLNNQPGDVLYDSQQQQKEVGKFQVTTDPEEKTVTVKFLDADKEKALDEALSQGVGNPPSPTPPPDQSGSQFPAPGQGTQQKPFEEANSPVQF